MTNAEERIRLGLADIQNIAAMIRENVTEIQGLSQVTIAKAAETDRLTDENRRLRAKVEEDAHTIDSLHGVLDDTRKELSATINRNGEVVRASILSNEQNQRLAAELAERDFEIAKLQLKLTNAGWRSAVLGETPAPDYITRAELVKVLRETAFTGIAADLLERLEFAP